MRLWVSKSRIFRLVRSDRFAGRSQIPGCARTNVSHCRCLCTNQARRFSDLQLVLATGSSQSKLRESWSVSQSLATFDGRSQYQTFPLVALEQVGSTWQTVLPETKSGASTNGRHTARPASEISSMDRYEAKSKSHNSET